MKLSLFAKRLAVMSVSAFMALGSISPTVIQVNAEEPEDGIEWTSEGITWEKVDSSEFEGLEPANPMDEESITPDMPKEGPVRVSIVLEGNSTIDAGYSAQSIAADKGAQSYRAQVLKNQQAMAKKISAEALGGKELDVVWNLTLGANIISANVPYFRIGLIKGVKGVKDVVIETRYEAADPAPADDPNMAVASDMTGTSLISSEFTGAGQSVAVIDTGIDTDHKSFDADAFDYAISTLDEQPDLLTKEDVAAVFGQLNVSQYRGLTPEMTYISSKIPFAFNYVDVSLDVTHDNDKQGEHGSHVAGIAAANRYIRTAENQYEEAVETVKTQGQAPDAQILVMKVFGSNGGAYDSDYFAAIEDAMVLGAASANLSLGSSVAGFAENATYADILDRFTEEDTNVVISMGNNSAWATHAGIGYLYSDDASFMTGGSPGSCTNSFTVASVDNDGLVGPTIKAYGNTIYYSNGSEAKNVELVTIGGEHGYIAIDGIGSDEEMAALKDVLPGKIAVVSRGTTSFYQKANAAVENGAIATIVYNNQPGTISMNMTGYLYTEPAVSITQADGQLLKDNAEAKTLEDGTAYYEGTLTIDNVAEVRKDEADYYKMSDFSSWGTTGDLNLKPDITAPGGNIYSVNGLIAGGQSYELMSGTSMAAPQIAGLTALMHQYIAENDLVNKTGKTEHQLTQSLLMSTAKALEETRDYGEDTPDYYYYSVLKQGAGLANIANATSSRSLIEVKGTTVNGTAVDKKAYTTSYADGKVKALLGEDAERTGKYTVTFDITNFSDEPVDYRFNGEIFTQDVFPYDTEYLDEWTAKLDAVVNFTVNGEELQAFDDPGMFDFNDDGVFNAWDAQTLLEYVVGTRESISDEEYADMDADGDIDTYDAYLALTYCREATATAGPGETLTVTAEIDLNGSLDELGNEERNGAYVEGYLFATERDNEEGVEGVEHSIPVLGYFGSWSEPSMTDKGSALEYAYDEETRDPYMYAQLGEDAEDVESFYVRYAGSSKAYMFGGNPYIADETYHPERNAINAGDTLSNITFSQIRNSAASRFTAADGDKVLNEKAYGQNYSAYYYEKDGVWQMTKANFAIDYTPGDDVEENTRLTFNYQMAPEYYVENGVTDWDALKDGSLVSIEATMDNTAPEFDGESPIMLGYDVEQKKFTALKMTVKDNQYIAAAYLGGEKSGPIDVYGADEEAEAGETRTFEFDLESVEPHIYLFVADYAANETIYKINLNQGELSDPVAVELDQDEYHVIKGGQLKAYATVTPWGIDESVTWEIADESIATVDQSGLITGITPGETTLTATALAGEKPSASAKVVVDEINKDLNAVIWDENGEIWFSEFNVGKLPDYSHISESVNLPLSSITYDAYGRMFGATLDSETLESVLYSIDESTYTATEIGTNSYGIGYMDLCMAPAMGSDILYSVYGSNLLFVDSSSGEMLMYIDLAEDIGGSYLVGVAYDRLVYYSQADIYMDYIWLIDQKSNLYRIGLYMYGEEIYGTSIQNGGAIADPVDIPYWQSLYFDGESIYFSRFNYDDNKVELAMVYDVFNLGIPLSAGYFANSVWPVGGLYEQNTYQPRVTVVSDKQIENTHLIPLAHSIEKISSVRKVSKGGLNAVNTAAHSRTALPIRQKVSANPVEDTSDEFTVTVRTDDESTNGLYVVTYDSEMVELISTKGLTKYNAIKDDVTGEVRVGFINEEALDADTGVADLVFRLKNDEKRTEIKVTTDQENDENTGAEDSVVIGPEKDVSYSFASGNEGTWTKESGKSMDFRIKRSINENRTGDHFEGVYVDGKLVDPSNYTIGKDGFTVSLKPEFLETLAPGKHTLKVVFDDGFCETTFTIEKAAPNTSDSNNTAGWLIVMLGAMMVAAAAAYRRKFSH